MLEKNGKGWRNVKEFVGSLWERCEKRVRSADVETFHTVPTQRPHWGKTRLIGGTWDPGETLNLDAIWHAAISQAALGSNGSQR